MFVDTVLSCLLLTFASGTSFYLTIKKLSYETPFRRPEILCASVGILAINIRSFFNLLSPFLYHNLYPIDPFEIEDEEKEKAILRIIPINEKICRVFSMSGLIYAVCESHKNRNIGIFIVSTLTTFEIYHAKVETISIYPRNKLFHFSWMVAGGFFGFLKGNYYCLTAYLPYGISFLALTPEKDCAWSIRRIVNNYMMMAHTFLMLEAICEARNVSVSG